MITRIQIETLILYGAILAALACGGGSADETDHEAWVRENYVKSEYMVPMRDGVHLYTLVYAPRDDSKEYPILLYRTPYSIQPYALDATRKKISGVLRGSASELLRKRQAGPCLDVVAADLR